MSQKIYKNGTWPILTSLTKVPHRSGLLALSATFIRPKNDTSLPADIDGVQIFGEPSVARSSDAMETITAVAYSTWGAGESDEVFNISLYDMPCYYWFQRGPSNQGFQPEGNTLRLSVVTESGWIKKIGNAIPTLSRPLAIIKPTTFSVTLPEDGRIVTGTPVLNPTLSMVKRSSYGSVTETEATYELRPYINLGTFYGPNAP